MSYTLPPLPYAFDALEPYIDAETMKLHHDKHHAAYVNNLNAAIEKHPELGKQKPEDLLRKLSEIPEDIRAAVRNNAGGHVNHTMFWTIMKPKGGEAGGKIAEQIGAPSLKELSEPIGFTPAYGDGGALAFRTVGPWG